MSSFYSTFSFICSQVDGDLDTDEEEDTGMGDIDVESGPAFLAV